MTVGSTGYENNGGKKRLWMKKWYEELTAFLQAVGGTEDSAASLSKAATVYQLLSIRQSY